MVPHAEVPNHHYRPELDGLRAIAVIAVLIFHLDSAWLPGGFAGVDVFFVLSGYLVTSILWRDHAAGCLSLRVFYQRRIARIFPAFLAMAVVTLGATKFCYTSWDFASAGASFSAALLSITNFHLLGQGDYFHLSKDAQPLLHCWSLSVEEQFYLIFPCGFALLLKTPPRLRLILMWLLTLLSFATCLVLSAVKPIHAFYLLPTRAWEMLAGSLLALHSVSAWRTKLPLNSSSASIPGPTSLLPGLTACFGLAAILASFLVLREGPHFPGWQALLPVLGTAAFIRSGQTAPTQRLLTWKPLVLTGKLSYSLYLWHWPVFSLVDYTLLFQSPGTRLLLKLTLTILTASFCYRCIERPARAWLNQPRRRWIPFLIPATALAVLAPAGSSIHQRHYLDASQSPDGVLTFPAPQPRGTLILIGDSQGSMYGQLARDLAAAHRLDLRILSAAGGDPLASAHGPSPSLFQRSLDIIRQDKPDVVLLACHWIYKLKEDPTRLALTHEAFAPHARRLIVLTQPPLLPAHATRAAIRQGSRAPWFENAGARRLRRHLNQIVQQQKGPNTTVVDTDPSFLHPDGSLVLFDSQGLSLFHDPVHLSTHGADRLKAAVEAAMNQTRSADL